MSERFTMAPYISRVASSMLSAMPSRSRCPRRWILLPADSLAPACHQYLDPRLYGQARHYLPDAPPEDVLQVRALGVHGFVARVGELAVMTPPLYSNPDLDKVVNGNEPLTHRHDLVDS